MVGPRLFTVCFGFGLPPLPIAALAIAFAESGWLGARETNLRSYPKSKPQASQRSTASMNSRPFLVGLRSLRPRRWIAAALVPLLLFAQLATAAYLCPQVSQAMSQATAMPLNCEMANADPEQPALCQVHCEAGARASGNWTDFAHPPLALDSQPTWRLPSRANDLICAATPTAPLPGGPPLYLVHVVFRE